MKILILADLYEWGGLGNHVKLLANKLIERGHFVYVVTTAPRPSYIKNGKMIIIKLPYVGSGVNLIYKHEYARYSPPAPDPLLVQYLIRIVQKIQPDVTHSHGWITASVTMVRNMVRNRIPVICTWHDYGFACPKRTLFNERIMKICSKISQHIERSKYLKIDKECLNCLLEIYEPYKALIIFSLIRTFRKYLLSCDLHIAVSSYVGKMLTHVGGVEPQRVKIVPNFVDVKLLHSLSERVPAQATAPESDVLFVGTFMPHKGFHVFLGAVKRLFKKGLRFKALAIGATSPIYPLPGIVDVKIIKDANHITVLDAYRKTKIVVVPSLSPDACPTAALEAMSFSKPVIGSKIGGLRDIILNGVTGLLVSPGNHVELANAIEELLSDERERSRMGRAAFKHVCEHFDAEKVISSIEKLYRYSIQMQDTE